VPTAKKIGVNILAFPPKMTPISNNHFNRFNVELKTKLNHALKHIQLVLL